MTQNSIDGVTVPLLWESIETVPPDTSVCAPSDTCQLDPVVPMYHHYDWSVYDSSTFPGIWTWFDKFGGAAKKVKLNSNWRVRGQSERTDASLCHKFELVQPFHDPMLPRPLTPVRT